MRSGSHCRRLALGAALLVYCFTSAGARAGEALWKARAVDPGLDAYFRAQVAEISGRCLADIKTREDWTSRREEYRRQLAEMLGLWPWPEKTDLKPVITGKLEHDEFTVEKLYFQSRPGLYVTGNLYVPKNLTGKAPAILYVCGHAGFKKDGISYGAKTQYQHHGAWLARNGYVCLVIDTLQLGEIEGIHHGTYSEKMWWWHSRGYTPAGVEAWNGIRAIDYLQSRPEVDPERIGMTGRSGGGATSWYTSALDERIKVAIPVAGITDLQNHVVKGCIEGHCDCMYMVNTYRWDFPQVAALVAPRALLIENTDKDTIFPLDGVMRVHDKVQQIYRLYNAEDKLGIIITEGPHHDCQELQICALKWFNRFLMKKETSTIELVAKKLFEPTQLRVFDKLPEDQINTRAHEVFVPMAEKIKLPDTKEAWEKMREEWMGQLKRQCFGGWPTVETPLATKELSSGRPNKFRLRMFEFTSQECVRIRLALVDDPAAPKRTVVDLTVLDSAQGPTTRPAHLEALWKAQWTALEQGHVLAHVLPRGTVPSWTGDEKKQTQIRRRFALIGQTVDGMRVWDVRRAIHALQEIEDTRNLPVHLSGAGQMAGIALYAALFEPSLARVSLSSLPGSHQDGPQFLNVLKIFDLPTALSLLKQQRTVGEAPEGPIDFFSSPAMIPPRLQGK